MRNYKNDNMNVPFAPRSRTLVVLRDGLGYGLTLSGDQPVFVQTVRPGGAAERAGVREGDVILRVDGRRVRIYIYIYISPNVEARYTVPFCTLRVLPLVRKLFAISFVPTPDTLMLRILRDVLTFAKPWKIH